MSDHKFIKDDILYVKNIIQHPQIYIDMAEKLGGWSRSTLAGDKDYYGSTRTSQHLSINPEEGREMKTLWSIFNTRIRILAKLYCSYYKHLQLTRDSGYDLLRYEKGQKFDEHIDFGAFRDDLLKRQISIIIYLNDDYLGGLAFPRQELVFRPAAGSAVVFPSNFLYPHASLPIEEGVKYSMVTWLC